jgi:hypothetical protein
MTAEQMKYEFDVGYDKITNFDAPGYEPKEISTFLTRAQESLVYEILNSSAFDEKNKKALSRLRQVIPLSTFTAGNYPNGFRTPLQVSVGGTDLWFLVATEPNTIVDLQGRFVTAGFRIGDQILISNAHTDTNDGLYTVKSVEAAKLVLFSALSFEEYGDAETTITVDPILRVRNERADIALGSTNFYYDKISGNAITDVEVDPIDDDFYSANKENPYKKPNVKKIWRIDGADETHKEHEYITDGTFTFTTVHLHIDRKPRPIIVPETTAVPYDTADGDIDGITFTDFNTGLDCHLDQIVHREIVEKAVKLAYAALQDEKGFQISSVQEQQE